MISFMKDYYRILDIPVNADKSDIEKAYQKLKNLILNKPLPLYSLVSFEEKHSFLSEIEEAYSVLINPERRHKYDILLRGATSTDNSDREIDSVKQLSFSFANEAFTYIDYTKRAEWIQSKPSIMKKNDYLTYSEGLSIRIVEEEDKEEVIEQDNIPKSIFEEEVKNIVSPTSDIQNITQSPLESQAICEKSDSLIMSETDTPSILLNQTDPSGSQYQAKKEKKEELVIDENTEFSGPLLKKIRESKGMDIKDIAKITKISTANIMYIEEENYKSLPALVYIKGYLAQIAKCLNIRPDIVVKSYISRMNERLERQEKKNK